MADPGRLQQLASAAAKSLGLAEGFKAYSPFPFAGMNQQSSEIAIDDKEFVYIENFFRLGDGYLRTAWDVGPSLYAAPANKTILSFFFYTIGVNFYAAVLLNDGSMVQVAYPSGVQTQIGPAGTFYSPGGNVSASAQNLLPAFAQYGTLYLLISNRNTNNDYWIWDGSLLYTAGTAAPGPITINDAGHSYVSTPTIVAYGGKGTGFAATPTIQNGQIVYLQITNPGSGYQVGDTVQLQFSGGGSDTAAILQANLTASGVAGVTVSAQGRGYTTATVAFSGGGGSGATATAVITGGKVTAINVTAPGTNYTDAPTVTINGDGTGASARSLLSATNVASVTVVNGGTNYISEPQVTFVGGGGSGATGIVNLTATTVARVNVTNGGSGYPAGTTVAFSSTAGGTLAAATATVVNGVVTAITMTNNGTGYTQPPVVTITGAGGSGATATAILTGTSIAGVTIQAGGQFYTSAPAVVISSPQANNAANATLTLMPYGVSGDSMETWQSRVWIANPAPPLFGTQNPGGNWQVSAPGSLTNFATSAGGVQFTNSDSFLQRKYTAIRQSNGYLYFFGDGSCSVVSNVQTSGNPTTTTFNYQNVDPQAGDSWRDARQDFGRSLVFANETGIYGLYGGTATKISAKLDKLFDKAQFPANFPSSVTPSGAIAHIHNVKHYMMLATILDPDLGTYNNKLICWDEKDWVIASQSNNLTYIGPQKIGSTYQAWGTNGSSLFPLFNQPSTSLVKRIDSKYYGADRPFIIKELLDFYVVTQDNSALNSGFTATISFNVSGIVPQNSNFGSVASGVYSNALIALPTGVSSPYPGWAVWGTGSVGLPFVTCGFRLTSQSPDFSIGHLVAAYKDIQGIG
jgi:hypothetical protein